MRKFEQELRKLTKLKPKKNEPREDFLMRLASAKLSGKQWENLSETTQRWLNNVTKQYEIFAAATYIYKAHKKLWLKTLYSTKNKEEEK